MKATLKFLVLAAALSSGLAQAAQQAIGAVPTAWRLQQYVGGVMIVYYTGASTCSNGGLILNGTDNEKNRFYGLVLASKLNKQGMFVYYEDTTCIISSFGRDG